MSGCILTKQLSRGTIKRNFWRLIWVKRDTLLWPYNHSEQTAQDLWAVDTSMSLRRSAAKYSVQNLCYIAIKRVSLQAKPWHIGGQPVTSDETEKLLVKRLILVCWDIHIYELCAVIKAYFDAEGQYIQRL
jgi:hypothetical protein